MEHYFKNIFVSQKKKKKKTEIMYYFDRFSKVQIVLYRIVLTTSMQF